MKKMLFATALLAGVGMMSSCSSDEVAGLNAPESPATGSDLVPVELALNGPSVSVEKRGIGTIGDIDGEEGNVWKGEKLRLIMMRRSEADGATWDFSNWSYTPDAPGGPVTEYNFANLEVTTPNGQASGKLTWDATDPKYYPNEGIHDFFAYNIDNAMYKGTGFEDTTPDYTEDGDNSNFILKDNETTDQKYVWFKIDGSQDLMAGIAVNDPETTGTNLGFSAATARDGKTPKITMQHLLTRFTFQVYPANTSAEGIIVTGITVKSKTTGKMIVAYDLGQGKTAPESLISFELPEGSEPAVEEPVALVLKDRDAANTNVKDLVAVTLANGQTSEAPANIGHALMVAPGETEYEMTITLKQTFTDSEGGNEATGTTTVTRMINIPSATVEEGEADATAQPGSSYNVKVKVYGMEKIEVEAELTGWKDGGDIDIDTNLTE